MVYRSRYGAGVTDQVESAEPRTFLPSDKNQFAIGGDAWSALNAGYQITLNSTGFIIDTWEQKTGFLFDILGNKTGERNTSFNGEDRILIDPAVGFDQNLDFVTYFPNHAPTFNPEGDIRGLLESGLEVTVDRSGNIIDIWNPSSGNILDINERIIGVRSKSYILSILAANNVTFATYFKSDLSKFNPDTDLYKWLSEDREVSVNSKGEIVNVWIHEQGLELLEAGNKVRVQEVPFLELVNEPNFVAPDPADVVGPPSSILKPIPSIAEQEAAADLAVSLIPTLPAEVTAAGTTVFFKTPIVVRNDTDRIDDSTEISLESWIPKGTTGIIASVVFQLEEDAQGFVFAEIGRGGGMTPGQLFAAFGRGDAKGDIKVPYGTVKLHDEDLRTIQWHVSKGGDLIRAKIILHGYVKAVNP